MLPLMRSEPQRFPGQHLAGPATLSNPLSIAEKQLGRASRTFKRRFGGGGRGRLGGVSAATAGAGWRAWMAPGCPGGPPSVRLPTFGRRQGGRVHADRCPVGGRGGHGEATRGRARRVRPAVGHGRAQTLRARRGVLSEHGPHNRMRARCRCDTAPASHPHSVSKGPHRHTVMCEGGKSFTIPSPRPAGSSEPQRVAAGSNRVQVPERLAARRRQTGFGASLSGARRAVDRRWVVEMASPGGADLQSGLQGHDVVQATRHRRNIRYVSSQRLSS